MDAQQAERDLIAATRDLLGSIVAPALAPFLAEWPGVPGRRAVVASALPVLRWLPDAAGEAPHFSAALAAALCRAAPSLAWCQTYTAKDLGADFLENYGWSELVGQRGPLMSERISCGFLLLGPTTLYPRHRHEAEEIYLPLAGTAAWQQGDRLWREQAPGTLIRHRSEEPHAMRTGAQPLLALYLWRGEDLSRKSRLDPPDRA
jgi:hypothetical protein